MGSSWLWSHVSWIYNYLCNQCLSPLTFWVRIPLIQGVHNTFCTTLCDKVCQWLATGRWFSPGTLVSTNKTDCHDIHEILLKVALNTKPLTLIFVHVYNLNETFLKTYFSHHSSLFEWISQTFSSLSEICMPLQETK